MIRDFSSAIELKKGDSLQDGFQSSSYYNSPEVVKDDFYNEKCDVWSAGVILFMLLTGKPPYDGKDDRGIRDSIKRGDFKYDDGDWKLLSTDVKALIHNGMLKYELDLRDTAEDCLNQFIWFKEGEKTDE